MTASELSVVETTQEHAADLTELLNEIVVIGGTTAQQTQLAVEEFTARYITNPAKIYCSTVIDMNGMLVGFQSLNHRQKLPDDWGDIATFAKVGTTARGIGSALFAATKEHATNARLVAINATIRADNVGGLRYYEKMGFVTYKVDEAVPLTDGKPTDRISKRFDL